MAIPRPEIVLGLTFAAGTDYRSSLSHLEHYLKGCGYKVQDVRFSDLFDDFPKLKTKIDRTSEFKRIKTLMDAGNEIRLITKSEDAVSLLGINQFFQMHEKTGHAPDMAHILHSFKHPEEVHTFRRIYGPGFFLIGLYESEAARKKHLMSKSMSESEAEILIRRDQKERVDAGQRVSDTFHLADVFLRSDRPRDMDRFLDLLFGNPFETPTLDEYGMFMAHAAALRSADLSRQVGAALFSGTRDILGVGANEVPKFKGGQYWSGDADDQRDYVLGYDPNERERVAVIEGLLSQVENEIADAHTRGKHLQRLMVKIRRGLGKLPTTEFGRVVHAEMEAIISCARKGLSPVNGTLYSTTFPCHICAKHIVAAGIRETVFIEPYPKSRALPLHPDSIVLDEGPEVVNENRVRFRPFLGISPRRYVDLFSMATSSGYQFKRKDEKGNKIPWINVGVPRIPIASLSYYEREAQHLDALRGII